MQGKLNGAKNCMLLICLCVEIVHLNVEEHLIEICLKTIFMGRALYNYYHYIHTNISSPPCWFDMSADLWIL